MIAEADSQLVPDPPPTEASRPFVVGVDGSRSGRHALTVAAHDATQAGADLLAVHVRTRHPIAESLLRTSSYLAPAVAAGTDWRDELEQDTRSDCHAVLSRTPVRWRFVVLDGDLVTELHQLAARAHAARIYVGARTRDGWRTCLHHCPARTLAHSDGPPVTIVEHR